MRTINFTQKAFEQFSEWKETNSEIQDRITCLIGDILRDPFLWLRKT